MTAYADWYYNGSFTFHTHGCGCCSDYEHFSGQDEVLQVLEEQIESVIMEFRHIKTYQYAIYMFGIETINELHTLWSNEQKTNKFEEYLEKIVLFVLFLCGVDGINYVWD